MRVIAKKKLALALPAWIQRTGQKREEARNMTTTTRASVVQVCTERRGGGANKNF